LRKKKASARKLAEAFCSIKLLWCGIQQRLLKYQPGAGVVVVVTPLMQKKFLKLLPIEIHKVSAFNV